MVKRYKAYFKLNVMSIVFIAISFMSVTLSWFAFSGITRLGMDVPVKAWYIELEKDGSIIHNDVIFSSSEIYPGMKTVSEYIKIKNLGDSDADVNYDIMSARILDTELVNETTTTSYIEDVLAQEYPFHININLSKRYVIAGGTESIFEVSISWPLDSDTDVVDSYWGNESYKFMKNEEIALSGDENYQKRSPIQVIISLSAVQYMESSDSSDFDYNLGDIILFDVVSNAKCSTIGGACISTHIIDVNNTRGSQIVTLLPNTYNDYTSSSFGDYDSVFNTVTSGWTVDKRHLKIKDIVAIIATDITNSFMVRDNLSNTIIGNVSYGSRLTVLNEKLVEYDGYYQFENSRFDFLMSTTCYWIGDEYDASKGYAVRKIDGDNSMVFGNDKQTSCKVIPVIEVSKSNLN